MELVVVSKERLFEQPPAASFNYPNQQGRHEMRDEVISSVGAQDMDTNGYQTSDLDAVECYWEKDQLDVDAVLKPGIDTLFSLRFSKDFEIGPLAENLSLIGDSKIRRTLRLQQH